MNVSYLIITHNRRDGLLANLASLFANDPQADVWIVDNASVDGTADALREMYPRVRLLQLDKNLGMPARNVALRQMTSEYVVLLDDDSHPIGNAVAWSTAHMDVHREVAAVVGRAVLPDGRSEASAMPAIMLGCATVVRLRALRDVGFFPHDFFRQAEEYDLSLRLWNAAYHVHRFEDLCYRHNKKPSPSRASRDVASLDLKHNLILAARYLPDSMVDSYWSDFAWRYGAILTNAGYAADVERVTEDAQRIARDAELLRRQELSEHAFEAVFEHRRQFRAVSRFASQKRLNRVVIADVSKNLLATYLACQLAGVEVTAVVDDRPAFAGGTYRDVPVISRRELSRSGIDGVVLSNTNPGQIDAAQESLMNVIDCPILRLWTPRHLTTETTSRIAA